MANHKSKIGGQALIEGIMMRGIDKISMSVRLPNGEIENETWGAVSLKEKKWFVKFPLVRGVFNLVESMILGYKCLMKSADKAGLDDFSDDAEPSKFDAWMQKVFGDKLMGIIMMLSSAIAILISIVLFMYLPSLAATWLGKLADLGFFRNIIEGAIKISIFITYLYFVSKIKDIQRVFQYHGAEHKTIACYEAGDELTVENVKKYTRFHPRCGTSFLIIVLILSILVFSVIPWGSALFRTLLKLLLMPVVVGLSYEIIRLAGRYDNFLTRAVSCPGIALQRLTTREPDDSQLEVAISAITPVIPEDKADDKW
jgi:uncharacterized protein YqhQ